MPYFFVDGYRDRKPASALYVQADNADAALVRAAQLGMEGTGVRPAKAVTTGEPETPKAFAIHYAIILVIVVLDSFSDWGSGAVPHRFVHGAVPIILLSGMLFRTYCLTYNQYVAQRELKANLQSMQATIELLQGERSSTRSRLNLKADES